MESPLVLPVLLTVLVRCNQLSSGLLAGKLRLQRLDMLTQDGGNGCLRVSIEPGARHGDYNGAQDVASRREYWCRDPRDTWKELVRRNADQLVADALELLAESSDGSDGMRREGLQLSPLKIVFAHFGWEKGEYGSGTSGGI